MAAWNFCCVSLCIVLTEGVCPHKTHRLHLTSLPNPREVLGGGALLEVTRSGGWRSQMGLVLL